LDPVNQLRDSPVTLEQWRRRFVGFRDSLTPALAAILEAIEKLGTGA
jgi:hypothetical protein